VRKRVPALLLNLNCVKVKTGKVNLIESSTLIAPCDGLLLKQTMGKICTSCPHSMSVATPGLPRPSDERPHLKRCLIPRRVHPKRTETCLQRVILLSLQNEISHLNVLERYFLVSPFSGFFLVFQQILDCVKPVDLH
jgi:hypothetical protein